MPENNIEKLYKNYFDLKKLEFEVYAAQEFYDNALQYIKEINDELIKNSYVPWFELIKFALSDKNIDFNIKNKFEELNKIISFDFGLDALNDNLSLKDIKSSVEKIKRAALEVKTSVENNGNCNKYDIDILDKIYKSIDSIDFLDLIDEIISENNKKYNILNLLKGKFAEHKFIEYLNNNNKTFFYIDNNQDSMCSALRQSKAKRPDLILILDKIFKVFVDVKNYSINKNNEFGINKKEIENFVNLEEQYSIPVFLAVSNGELQFNTWYFVSVNKIFEDKKNLIKKNYKGTVDLYYINSEDPIFYKAQKENKFDDKFLIANNSEILNNIKLLTGYFKNLY